MNRPDTIEDIKNKLGENELSTRLFRLEQCLIEEIIILQTKENKLIDVNLQIEELEKDRLHCKERIRYHKEGVAETCKNIKETVSDAIKYLINQEKETSNETNI